MSWTIAKTDLSRMLAEVALAKTRFPISVALSGKDGLRLTAKDEDNHLQAETSIALPGQGLDSAGAVEVVYEQLKQTVGTMRGEIAIDLAEESLIVAGSGRSAVLLMWAAPDDDRLTKPAVGVTVPGTELARAVTAVKRIAAKASSLPEILTGIHLVTRDGELWCEAADGFTAAAAVVGPVDGDLNVVVPAKDLTAVRPFAGDVVIGLRNGFVTLWGEHRAWEARALDGTFPDILKVRADARGLVNPTTVDVERVALLNAVKAVLPVAQDGCHVEFCLGSGVLELDAFSELGRQKVNLGAPVVNLRPETELIALDGTFVRAILQSCRTERVRMSARSDRAGVLVSEVDGRSWYLVMPRLSWNTSAERTATAEAVA